MIPSVTPDLRLSSYWFAMSRLCSMGDVELVDVIVSSFADKHGKRWWLSSSSLNVISLDRQFSIVRFDCSDALFEEILCSASKRRFPSDTLELEPKQTEVSSGLKLDISREIANGDRDICSWQSRPILFTENIGSLCIRLCVRLSKSKVLAVFFSLLDKFSYGMYFDFHPVLVFPSLSLSQVSTMFLIQRLMKISNQSHFAQSLYSWSQHNTKENFSTSTENILLLFHVSLPV